VKAGILWGIILGVSLGGWISWAQMAPAPSGAPKPAPAAAGASAAPAGTASAPQAAKGQARPTPSGKRRDPFNSLIPTKKPEESVIPLRLPPGKKGLVIEQLLLQGIVRGIDGGWIAVVDNRTKRAYFLHEKDEVYNGVVSKITPDSVVFTESATDALGKVATREVVKRLAPE
jgi:hypothetical protein